nr:hypothetical protein [uncultured Mediterranean phage uvMED]
MSILSVDTISPIGSGTTVTLNATETKVNNFITVGTGASISSPSSNVLTLGTNNTEGLRIKSDGVLLLPTTGKLSLGMSSPAAQFTAGTANGSRVIEIQGTDGVIRGYNRNSSAWAQIDFEASSYSFDCGGAEKLNITSTGNVTVGGHTAALSTYNSSQPRLSVYKSSGSGGYLELGGNIPHNGHSSGTILFINNDNSEATSNNANGKILAMQRVENVTSDTNAGDDMGGDLAFHIKPESGSLTEHLRLKSDGNVTINDGNLILASGHGIDFSSYDPTSYGSISSEILDDYEEGSWTPVIPGSGMSLTVYVATYIKIGKLVHVECGILIPTNSDGSGLQLGGLPYQAQSSGDNSGGLHLTSTNSGRSDHMFAIRNSTNIGVANNNNQNVARSAYSNKQLKFSGTYMSTF